MHLSIKGCCRIGSLSRNGSHQVFLFFGFHDGHLLQYCFSTVHVIEWLESILIWYLLLILSTASDCFCTQIVYQFAHVDLIGWLLEIESDSHYMENYSMCNNCITDWLFLLCYLINYIIWPSTQSSVSIVLVVADYNIFSTIPMLFCECIYLC